jgi:prepilin-type N-terminal cleavage/methylation domain-containing protein/prepilin-type processing-associated H-X9-DG protein
MRHSLKRGFTLVELLVVIAIIGTLVALLLPAVQAARGTAQNNTCKNNIRQLAMAAINMDSQLKLPGYINTLENLSSSKDGDPPQFTGGRRASWIVMLFPYMENGALWDAWSKEFNLDATQERERLLAFIENLTCPSDAPETPGEPWTNYVCNAGQAFSDPTRGSNSPAGLSAANTEYAANGVFFDVNVNKNINASRLDGREGAQIRSRLANIADGGSKTMMLAENAQAWYWLCAANNPDGTLNINPTYPDTKHSFGFVWSNRPNQIQRINGSQASSVVPLSDMQTFAALANESYGWPSSLHPGGVNIAFCDGHVVFVPETVEPLVYGQLMTSNAKRSKLFDENRPANQAADRVLPQPEPTF